MNKYKNFIMGFLFVILMPFSLANVEINIPDSFDLGEKTYFDYTLISDINTHMVFIPYIICPSSPNAPLMEIDVELFSGQSYENTYPGIVVQDWFEPQTCTAYIQIISPIQQTVSKNFSIITDPSFSFNIKLDKKIFIQNENIYFDYTSDTENLSMTSTLTYPDKTTESITLPTSIKAEQIGTYELDITASKEDYKTITKKEQFGVIKEQANIKTTTSSDLNENNIGKKIFYISISLLFVLIIALIIFLVIRKNLNN